MNYEYWYFENQKSYFEQVEALLNENFQLTDSVHLCVEFCKENQYYLLSFINVEEQFINENIKDYLHSLDKTMPIVLPDYSDSMLNTIASIRKYYHGKINYPTDLQMDELLKKKFKHLVVLLLDGLGDSVLNQFLPKNSFLRRHQVSTRHAIFPSTTAAATTAIISGRAPLETGWLGWENYFKEVNQNLILFTGVDYYTDEPTSFEVKKYLPYQSFFDDLNVSGCLIMPEFKEDEDPFDVLEKSLQKLESTTLQYVYVTQPDGILHEYGVGSLEASKVLTKLDEKVQNYASRLPQDTLLVITADHGHTNVKQIEFYKCQILYKMLNRNPANDSRAITFSVKEEYKEQFKFLFEKLFGYAYQLYDSSELIQKGFFGNPNGEISPRAFDFLADYIAVATKDYYFNYKNEQSPIMKSHHAGMTKDEMIVPWIIYQS